MELLTTAQAAKRLGVARRTLAEWAQEDKIATAGKLPGIRGAWLFDPAVIEEMLDEVDEG